jgi:3D (Asp-Asp-Asp) domain-containing protein
MTDSTDANDATTLIDTLGAVVRAGVGCLSDFFARILNGIRGLAPLVLGLGLGCQSQSPTPVASPPPPAPTLVVVAPADAGPSPDAPRALGGFHITFDYVIGEEEVAVKRPVVAARPANDNAVVAAQPEAAADVDAGADVPEPDTTLVAMAPPTQITLFRGGGACEPIARVSREFASEIELQGTGKLLDGRVLNIWGACPCGHSPCFSVTGSQWGTSGSGHPLSPFRTVAVDPRVIKVGSLLYIPALEGRRMPGHEPWGGFVHDGCVVADDTGGGIDGNQLDLFVGRKAYYLGLANGGGSHGWAKHAEVFDGTGLCERKGRVVSRIPAAI